MINFIICKGQKFEAFICSYCGGRGSDKISIELHEARHEEQLAELKGGTGGLRGIFQKHSRMMETPGEKRGQIKQRAKCLEVECDRIATAKGRCGRCHERWKSVRKGTRDPTRDKTLLKSAGHTAAIAGTAGAFIQDATASV